jgi:Family of unknown function (DUF5681)
MRSKQQGNSMTIGKPFQKGQSGNPGGRPKVVAEVRELAREHTSNAVETLVSIMNNPKAAPANVFDHNAARLAKMIKMIVQILYEVLRFARDVSAT